MSNLLNMSAKSIDNIVFAIGTGVAKSGDEIASVSGSVAKVVNKFDPRSVIKGMGSASFFKNAKIPAIPLRTSKLFHTAEALTNLKKIDLKALVPKQTSDLMDSLAKSADDINLSKVDDVAASLRKVDVGDAKAIAGIAKNSSLSKLRNISEQIAQQAKKNGDFVVNKKALNFADDAAFKNADEMAASLKNSSGLSKSLDDLADSSKGLAKKVDDLGGGVDDLARQAKKSSNVVQALKFAKKHEAVLSLGIVGSFMVAEYVTGKSGATFTTNDGANVGALSDPGDADEVSSITSSRIYEDLRSIDESDGDNVLGSNGVILGVLAAGAASMAL